MKFHLSKRKLAIIAFIVLSIPLIPSFISHIKFFLSGQITFFMKQNAWLLVIGSILFFTAFLLPLKYRRKAEWKSFGIYTAFLISLFVEMYGIPLSFYLSSSIITMPSSGQIPNLIITMYGFALNLWMLIGLVITGIGCTIVGIGWYQIYKAQGLASNGIYRYSRHPQYLGIILICLGWFVGWPTIPTAIILPILIYQYYKLALREEEEALQEFGERYETYIEGTPRFI